jgi:hypothetical protein
MRASVPNFGFWRERAVKNKRDLRQVKKTELKKTELELPSDSSAKDGLNKELKKQFTKKGKGDIDVDPNNRKWKSGSQNDGQNGHGQPCR